MYTCELFVVERLAQHCYNIHARSILKFMAPSTEETFYLLARQLSKTTQLKVLGVTILYFTP